MAPHTYVGLALGVAPIGRICFGSLEFINANRPTPAFGLLPSQAICFGDLDFIADHLGQLHLHEGDAALLHTPSPNLGPTYVSPAIINSDALACRIDSYLGTNPESEQSQRVFYRLANAFTQLSGDGLMPQET
jgi:hypothetical protein